MRMIRSSHKTKILLTYAITDSNTQLDVGNVMNARTDRRNRIPDWTLAARESNPSPPGKEIATTLTSFHTY